MSNIQQFMPVSESLCYLRIDGWKFDICIIILLPLTEHHDEKVKNIFYEDIEILFHSLTINCIKIITVDPNAQVAGEQP